MKLVLPSIITILFALFATAVMSYVAMATATGPWIEPTLVLLGALIFRALCSSYSSTTINSAIGLTTAGGALGGIIAVACGWAFPTLYFLDASLFNSWLSHPFYFCALLGATVAAGTLLAWIIAEISEPYFLHDKNMPFAIGELVSSMIEAQQRTRESIELACGALGATAFNALQGCTRLLPRTITLMPRLSFSIFEIAPVLIKLEVIALFWAIGFITGHMLAIPLGWGLVSKYLVVDPMQKLFFASLSKESFLLAFITGMVVQGAVRGFLDIPHFITSAFKYAKNSSLKNSFFSSAVSKNIWYKLSISTILLCGFLSYFNFSLLAQLYIIAFTALCTYQLLIIAGKTGLAPFPRFATFVMMPGVLLFGFNPVQITIVSTFVEVCGGVAVDLLFGRKMAQITGIEKRNVLIFQLVGIIATILCIGTIFWLLISHLGLGTPELFVQRAHARALLVQTTQFDYRVMLLGALFSLLLGWVKINAVLVIGGLAMPPDLSIILIAAGLSTYLVKSKERYYPFWSGVFAACSLWMVIKTML